MRCRRVAGAIGLGCAGLMMLALVAPAAANQRGPAGYRGGQDAPECQRVADGCDRPGRMGGSDVGADCRQAAMEAREGSGGLKIATDVPDGATVPPGQDITVTLTWDPNAWSGQDVDAALACVKVKGGLDPDLSEGERPASNDGVMEYRLHVPDTIRPDCDICVQGFLMGPASDGGPGQATSDTRCFMSGPPGPPSPPDTRPPSPPATQPPTPPATQPPTPVTTAPRTPTEVGGIAASQPSQGPLTPAPAAPDTAVAPGGELPRTGSPVTDLISAAGGLSLTFGGFAVMGGASRRKRGRANR